MLRSVPPPSATRLGSSRRPFNRAFGRLAAVGVAFASAACTAFLDAPDSTFQDPPLKFARVLSAPNPQAGARFGDRVAISGTSIAVTAPFEAASGQAALPIDAPAGAIPNGEGATYLYDASSLDLAPLRIIAPNADPGDGQISTAVLNFMVSATGNLSGQTVALNEDVLIVGAGGEDGALASDDAAQTNDDAPESGAVYVYARSALASGSVQPQYIKAPNVGAGDLFGTSLALSGTRLVIGAPGEDSASADDPSDDSAADSGAVYSFVRQDGRFVFEQYIKAPAPIQGAELFGAAVALDGELLVVGAPSESSASTGVGGERNDASSFADGAAYVYRLVDARWQFEEYLKPQLARTPSLFGAAVRVWHERIAVGAPAAANCGDESLGTDDRGVLDTFVHSDDGWSFEQCLSPSTALRRDLFGESIGMWGDRLLVGAPWDASGRPDAVADSSIDFAGATYVEERDAGSSWQRRAYLKAPAIGRNDVFGAALELSADLAVIGAPQRSLSGPSSNANAYAGAIYLYDVTPL
jgi:hypothetical protein